MSVQVDYILPRLHTSYPHGLRWWTWGSVPELHALPMHWVGRAMEALHTGIEGVGEMSCCRHRYGRVGKWVVHTGMDRVANAVRARV